MGQLERELAALIEQIKLTERKPEEGDRAELLESKRRLCDLMAVLG